MAVETEEERIDRELIELLNELRVALPGVQVLFAFLLTLPFMQGFDRVTGADRHVYFASVVLAALSSAFLIAPSAHHRARFRDRAKEQVLKAASVYALVGLVLLSTAMATTLYVMTSAVYGAGPAAICAGAIGGFIVLFWFVVPLAYRSDPTD
jgi:SNF family Na+-dependent transporter